MELAGPGRAALTGGGGGGGGGGMGCGRGTPGGGGLSSCAQALAATPTTARTQAIRRNVTKGAYEGLRPRATGGYGTRRRSPTTSSWISPFVATTSPRSGVVGPPSTSVRRAPASAATSMPAARSQGLSLCSQ